MSDSSERREAIRQEAAALGIDVESLINDGGLDAVEREIDRIKYELANPNNIIDTRAIGDTLAQLGDPRSVQEYMEAIYGPGGTFLDANRYQLPAGRTEGMGLVNPETGVDWNPKDAGLMKWMPYLLAAGAAAGGVAAGAGAAEAGAAGVDAGLAMELAPGVTQGIGSSTLAGGAAAGGASQAAATAAGSGAVDAAGGMVTQGAAGLSGLNAVGAAGSAASGVGGLAGSTPSTFGIPNNILSGAAQGIGGWLAADAQGDAYGDVASQYLNLGAPYRDYLNQSYQPGFNLASQPGYGDAFGRMADISARSYSARMGNPADNPTAQAGILGDVWNQSYLPALSNYRGQLGQFGGLGLNTSGSASMGQAGSAGSGWEAIGAGIGTALTPQNSWEDMAKRYGLNIGGMSYKG